MDWGARAGCVVLAGRTCPLVRAGNVTLGIRVGVEDAGGGGRVGPLGPEACASSGCIVCFDKSDIHWAGRSPSRLLVNV